MRLLADDQIAYEADAILLVECDGDERFVTPIIKPPRPAHLMRSNGSTPAMLASSVARRGPMCSAICKAAPRAQRRSKAGLPSPKQCASAPAPRGCRLCQHNTNDD
ncbi:MAG: hypothetical protein C0183_05230 [Roseiflexus castenholzii]|nr:MAG: hypothetical protein C0183_05230 [Roseiflexus castenholzii]